MPKDLLKENVPTGEVVYEWWIKEYDKQEHSKRWYTIATIMVIGLLVYAVISQNYLFALTVVLFGIIIYLHDMQAPLDVYFALTNTGIILGKKFYRYNELSGFWIIYNPPEVKNLYFGLDNVVKHRLQVPLLDYDPRPVRDHLKRYLSEELDQEEEPFSDKMARAFKL